jgi:hemerythrin-like domain-containing protein
MLSAESAWRILHAEHARMHELVRVIESATLADGWRHQGRALTSLIESIRYLQSFDDATHRPKGVALFAALKGRAPQADSLITRLEKDCEQRDRMLAEALEQLVEVGQGNAAAADTAKHLLDQHRAILRGDLELEDTALRDEATRLLSPQEWSAIVSSISTVIASPGLRTRLR